MKIPFISNWLEKRSDTSNLSDPKQWLIDLFGGRQTKAGITVSEKTSMNYMPVFACVRVISETVASLPLPVYKRLEPRGKERATNHPLYKLLHDKPNGMMTSFTFRETLMAHILLWGNAYAEIEYGDRGAIKALWPLPPHKVTILETGDSIFYEVSLPDGQKKVFPAYQVLHIPGLGFDGLKGHSVISLAKDAIGLGMALEQFGSEFFANGTNVGAIVMHPGRLSDSAFSNLKKSLTEKYEGLGKSHRLMLLEEGMRFEKNTIPPNDAQFLESRKFQKNEIASLFRVPPHLIGDLERATFSNIEHQSIDFVVHTIRPWLVRWEQALKWKLFGSDTEHFAEFLVEGLLRGDIESRYRAYAIGRQWGWLSSNDVRELENMNPLPDEQGDMYLVPMNMIPADQAKLPEPKPPPVDDDNRSIETRKREERNRQALARFRTAQSYERVFKDAANRVVRREKEKIIVEARKQLNTRSSQLFFDWLEDFYEREFPDYFRKQMSAPVSSLAMAIKSLAEQEVNAEDIDVNKAINDYLESFSIRYTRSSKNQLRKLVEQALLEEDDPLGAVEDRLDEWEEKKPDKVAMNETIQVGGFIAKVVFAGAGIQTLRWVNTGSQTCEFCSKLDGKVVGINEPFLSSSQEIVSKDGYMNIRGPKTQPPLHQGCQCTIVPE